MKTIIIDDEKRARQLLRAMLNDYCPEVEVAEDCDDLPNGVKAIKKYAPKLVFLDIEMPGHSGLELLDFFNEEEINFDIIFTTAYNQYAVQAFKMSAVDYLLKPVSPQLLKEAVDRAKRKQEKDTHVYSLLKHQLSSESTKKLAVPQLNGIKFIQLNDLIYLKGDRAYTEIYSRNAPMLLASRNLKYFEDALENVPQFFRCHKSFIVNISFIKEYIKSDGGYLIVEGNQQLNLSAEKADELMEKIGLKK